MNGFKPIQHFLRRFVGPELGLVLHVGKEGWQVAREADLLFHPLHFRTQAPDLAQAGLVDFVGGFGGGGGSFHRVAVGRGPAGQGTITRGGARLGQVLVFQEDTQLLIGGHQLGGNGLLVSRGQPRFVGGGHRVGQLGDGAIEHALGGVDHHHGLQLRNHLHDQRPGQYHASFHAVAEVGNGRVGPGREPAYATQPVVVVHGRLKGLGTRARPKLGHALRQPARLAKGHHPLELLEFFHRHFQLVAEHVVAHLVFGRELGAVNLQERRLVLLVETLQLLAEGPGLVVGQLVVVAVVALGRSIKGKQLGLLVPVSGKQGRQRSRGGRLTGGSGRGLSRFGGLCKRGNRQVKGQQGANGERGQ